MGVINVIKALFGFVLSAGFKLILWTAIIVFFGIFTYSNLQRLDKIDNANEELKVKIEDAKRENDELLNQNEYTETDAYIESTARKWLGLVMPDEILFIKKPKSSN